ncbi:MAG: aldehyde ferredoxin oxidoreductase C-terminal domain-containing protein [Firmicutes bacterium]|nr:aldehyde ferredoxin oxidoreductase C-terminal domain-containing protein [Bacillota bacterium]
MFRTRRLYGTASLVALANEANLFPTRYWSGGRVDSPGSIDGDYLLANLKVEPRPCLHCSLNCGKQSTVTRGPYRGLSARGPEYETIYAFGGLCSVGSLEEVVHLAHRCEDLGLDTITAGNVAAFAVEASRKGGLSLSLDYGDTGGIAGLLDRIARREGPGEILAGGVREAARRLSMDDIAVHVKGLEPAGYDPRVLKGMALSYATSPRGACHMRAGFYQPELDGRVDPEAIRGKAKLFVDYEDRMTLFDSLILCRFMKELVGWDELSEILEAVCGRPFRPEELRETASRIVDCTRLFNLRAGLTWRDDTLPDRFFREPLSENGKGHRGGLVAGMRSSGGDGAGDRPARTGNGDGKRWGGGTDDRAGKRLTREELRVMVEEYYACRGWDEEGRPRSHTLKAVTGDESFRSGSAAGVRS